MPVDFYGPLLKIERAEHHVDVLETIFRRYVSNNVKRLRPERKHRLLKRGQVATSATFPRHTPTVLGDALHNLRAALDHAYCILVEANGSKFTQWTSFPFRDKPDYLHDFFKGQKKEGLAPRESVINAIIDELQPYEGGKLGLHGLHRLDITDKHHILIPTQSVMRIDHLDIVNSQGMKTGGGISGMSIVTLNKSQGSRSEFIEFGVGGGAVLEGNPKDAFDICFEHGQPFGGESIIKTVRKLRDSTVEALETLRRNA